MASVDVSKLLETALEAATELGGNVWNKIKKSSPIYLKGYLQTIAEIAEQRARNQVTGGDAKLYARNAQYLLVQGIANTAQVFLSEVQGFINKLIGAAKDAINKALPIAIL